MTLSSRSIRRLFLVALLVLGAVTAGVSSLAEARPAPTLHLAQTPKCLGKPATIVGRGAIHGTGHADVIVASAGVDHIVGGAGNDRICAGGGDDTIEGGIGSSHPDLRAGRDRTLFLTLARRLESRDGQVWL